MINKWQLFLSQNIESDNIDKTFPASELVLTDLSSYGLLKVSGDDAESFLQNQLTNDIRNVTNTTHQISAWCSPKGRMIVSFRVFKQEDSYILILSADLLAHVIKKLRMYVMMSKVTIEDISNSYIHFGLSGEDSDKVIQDCCDNKLSLGDSTLALSYNSLSILQVTGDKNRFEVFAGIDSGFDDTTKIWTTAKAYNAVATNANHWHYLDILSGLPNIQSDSSEAWIPQMINYTFINGVDFKKGCYPGQEVVARLNYLGKTKRRMYLLEIDTSEAPKAGDVISSESDKEAGKVLSATVTPEGKVKALAVLKIAEAQKPITLTDKNSEIRVCNLPYSVDDNT